jgi:hypothetical protein
MFAKERCKFSRLRDPVLGAARPFRLVGAMTDAGKRSSKWDALKSRSFEVRLISQLERIEARLKSVEQGQKRTAQTLAAETGEGNSSAYEVLMNEAHESGQSRSSMDEIVRHLEASQARHELATVQRKSGLRQLVQRASSCVIHAACIGRQGRVPRFHPETRRRFRWKLFVFLVNVLCCLVV